MPEAVQSSTGGRVPPVAIEIAGVAALAAAIAWVSSLGGPHDAWTGFVTVAYTLAVASPPILAYLLGAIGLGSLCSRWTRSARDRLAIECGLGLALMLSASHALGVLGLLSGPVGLLTGGGAVLLGIILLARRILAHIRASGGVVTGTVPWPVLLGVPVLAVLLVAACNPPGWLWDSEHRGYDALSYHLQLPQEWIQTGRIWPVDHNVYSYLPGYVESAFYHIAAMSGAPAMGRAKSLPMGLLAGEGHGLITCQLLHAGLAILAATMVGRWASRRCGRSIGALAGVLFLSIPWVIVTGSLAYNEMGVSVLFAAAMIAAGDEGLGARVKGLVSGVLVGVACGCKPTAIFMCAPVVGLILLSQRGTNSIVRGGVTRALVWAVAGGALAIAPWIARNWIACGNPVFPMATGLFGTGHWTIEQAQRYAAGHKFAGSVAERLQLLLGPGTPDEPPRGLLHPQWAILPAVAMIAWVVAVIRRHTRREGVVLGIGALMQLMAWLMFTHLQSRFLLPLAVPACGLVALGLTAILKLVVQSDLSARRTRTNAATIGAGALICVGHAGLAIGTFKGQSKGEPNRWLVMGPGFRSGELDRRAVAAEPAAAADLVERAWPEVRVNVYTAPGTKVYLIGDSAALYYTSPILYNTTWDAWPLGEAMRKAPGDHAAWTRELLGRGVRLVMVNAPEIDRLHKSGTGGAANGGWADPLVTNESVSVWLKEEGRLIRSWPEIGVHLFELRGDR